MKDQKAENLLNLALSVPEEERKQTGELDVGYDRETRTWELIVKYSGDLAGIVREKFPEAELKELSGGFGILTVPEEEVPGILELKEIEYAEKPKRLFFAITRQRQPLVLLWCSRGRRGLRAGEFWWGSWIPALIISMETSVMRTAPAGSCF